MNKPSLLSILPIGIITYLFIANLPFSNLTESVYKAEQQPVETTVVAEEFCAHDQTMADMLAQDPMFQEKHDAFEKALQKHVQALQSNNTNHAPVLYTLPVVVHVIHDGGAENITDAQVFQGVQDLNDAFANMGYYDQGTGVDTEVQFCMAKRDPDGNATNGITRDQSTLTDMIMETDDITVKDLNRWEPEDYVNIWLVRSITSLSSGPGVAGYAYFPTSHGGPEDGIMMEAEFFGSSQSNSIVQAHEVGHYLGLYHTFQNGCANNDCLTDGDRVCDTPPDQSTAWVPCNSTPNTCDTDPLSGFATDVVDMFWNYMDYSDFECYSAFTQGQTDRMHFTITDVRSSLLDSDGCTDPCTSEITSSFTANVTTIEAGGTVNFTNTSTNATTYDWRVDGTNFSNGTNSSYTFNTVGSFDVTLFGFNGDPNCEDDFTITIEVTCPVDAQFSFTNLFPALNETVNFGNLSTGATTYNWLLNGVSQGSTSDFSYTFTIAGTFTVCLEAASPFCDDIACTTLVVFDNSGGCPPPCLEICDNGLDDDNDGYIDCYDIDCPCNTDECTVTDLTQNFATELAWQSPDNRASVGGSPLVMDMNPWVDSIPEIIITHASTNIFSSPCQEFLIYKGDGSNAANPNRVQVAGGFDGYPDPGAGLGDVNGDGIPELVIVNMDREVLVYTDFDENAAPASAMSLMVTSSDLADDKNRRAYLADFNSDGISEIYVGDDIFEFDFSTATPTLTKALSGGSSLGQLFYLTYSQGGCSPVAADVLDPSHCGGDPDCNGIELVAGNVIYSVDMSTTDGDGYQIKIQRDLNDLDPGTANWRDGYTVVADVDLDGIMDVVVSSGRNSTRGAYAWNRNGLLAFFPNPTNASAAGGMPCVANVYNDMANGAAEDFPEIIVCSADRLNAFNINAANMGMPLNSWWNLVTDDLSAITGTTVFDFNGDGVEEIVYRDEDNLRILYGGTAPFPPGVDNERNWDTFVAGSGTMDEHPIVADVDNDKQAEIVVTSYLTPGLGNPAGDYRGRLRVFESDPATGDPWMSARQIWNQFNYFVVNVNDDLSIPVQQQLHHLEFPQVGSGYRPLNKYLAQASLLNNDGQVYLPVPDAVVAVDSVICGPDSVTVTITVCNDGDALLPQVTPIAFYIGDPTAGAAPLHHVALFGANVFPDQCVTQEIKAPNVTGNIFVTVNDDGSQPTPYNFGVDFPVTNIVECIYINNPATFSFSLSPPNPPNLGPDLSFCNNGTAVLDAGAGWESYQWQDGHPEQTYTAWEEGTYWVNVTDACGSIYSDTIVITMDTSLQFDLGPDTVFCLGQILTFDVPGFDEYEWLPDYEIDCNNCPIVNVTPMVDTTYTLVATDANGCLSVDSISIIISGSVELFDTVQLCTGDSIFLFGNFETMPGDYAGTLPNANGCDTLLTVTVEGLPLIQASETLTICEGDSISIFGNLETQAGTYLDTLPSMLGCDTAMAITLQVNPLILANETIDICQGDSALIFGNYVFTAGNYVDTLSSTTTGCDTVMTVTLQVNPLPTASQNISICDGDSILLFGNFEASSGQFVGLAPNANGCDTILTINLNVTPPISLSLDTEDSCPGEGTGSVTPTITNGTMPFVYQWSNNENSPELNGIDAGPYSLTLTDVIGCSAVANANVGTVITSLVSTDVEDVTCFGFSDGTLTVSGYEPGSLFSLDGLFFSSDTVFANLPAGNVTLFVQTPDGCTVEQTVNVMQPSELIVTLPPDMSIELGDSVLLSSQVNSLDTLDYNWTPSEWLNCADCPGPWATPFETISYTVSVSNDGGCSGEDDIQIFVRRTVNVFVPNVFSPNGDGINDVFTIFSGTGVVGVKRLMVFDRWGELTFEHYNFPANDPSYGWDGMFKDEMMGPAVFAWFAEIEMIDGRIEMMKGDVTLVR